jgi:hypothetical protein
VFAKAFTLRVLAQQAPGFFPIRHFSPFGVYRNPERCRQKLSATSHAQIWGEFVAAIRKERREQHLKGASMLFF